MLIGYARISKADGSQWLNLQMDALVEAGVVENRIYSDRVSGETAGYNLWQSQGFVVMPCSQLGRFLRI